MSSSSLQVPFLQGRITNTEKSYGELCSIFGSLLRREAKHRDKVDELAVALLQHAAHDKLARSMSEHLLEYAQSLVDLNDYRQAKVEALDNNIVGLLQDYDTRCKTARETVRSNVTAIELQQKKEAALRTARQGTNVTAVKKEQATAEAAFQSACADSAKAGKIMENEIFQFERTKQSDLKKMLTEYTLIELAFHSKALEKMTEAFKVIHDVDTEQDFEAFAFSLLNATADTSKQSSTADTSKPSSTAATPTATPKKVPAATPSSSGPPKPPRSGASSAASSYAAGRSSTTSLFMAGGGNRAETKTPSEYYDDEEEDEYEDEEEDEDETYTEQ